MRTQISTNVSERTRKQADELMARHGYSLRDVVSIAIDRLYREEVIDVPDTCPHGVPLSQACDKCLAQIQEFREAQERGDARAMERASRKMRKDHENQSK